LQLSIDFSPVSDDQRHACAQLDGVFDFAWRVHDVENSFRDDRSQPTLGMDRVVKNGDGRPGWRYRLESSLSDSGLASEGPYRVDARQLRDRNEVGASGRSCRAVCTPIAFSISGCIPTSQL
jgi:hypothetical protein